MDDFEDLEDCNIELAESPDRAVTSARRPGTPAAERKRQQRERDRGAALLFERDDWMLFLDPATLSQKAGCQPEHLRQLVLRELVDNALDAGAQVTMRQVEGGWSIADDGPGLDPVDVPRLFAVNRPLVSSKLLRLPLRGMLGNGLRVVVGAVTASEGSLVVETRGHRLTLAADPANGTTAVVDDQPIPDVPGLVVHITFGRHLPRYSLDDAKLARNAIIIASYGTGYDGPSSPWWYSSRDLHLLMQRVTPTDTTVGSLCQNLGFELDDHRVSRTLDIVDAKAVLDQMRQDTKPVEPKALGAIGPDVCGDDYSYSCRTGFTPERGAEIPFVVEAWAHCERTEGRKNGSAEIQLFLNRTPSAARITARSDVDGLLMHGCGLHRAITGPKTGNYQISVGVICPHIDLAGDGKEPVLAPFSEAIATVMRKACGAAHRAMEKPSNGMSFKDAAWQVMPEAYRIASSDGTLPANARQIMYAARGAILELTGKEKLGDAYFTQNLLPDYIEKHLESTTDWDVVFDDRGTFIEPHTGRVVPLGTVEVRQYLGERPMSEISARLDSGAMAPTAGLAPSIETVLVMHDFDISGFIIFGTLGSNSRRYKFDNDVNVIDIGLRLADVREMGLTSESVDIEEESWSKRSDTLAGHGATPEEIRFLRNDRVELNAMPSDVFIQFLERKLIEHGVRKVVPTVDVLQQHARRVIEREFINRAVDEVREQAEAAAAAVELPEDLHQQVVAALDREPRIPWDIATAGIAIQLIGGAS